MTPPLLSDKPGEKKPGMCATAPTIAGLGHSLIAVNNN
jgi:hypothetical protein